MKLQLNSTYLLMAFILLLIELTIAVIGGSGFIRHTFGDYLVVILLYALLRGCTTLGIWSSSLIVLLFAYTVEFLQLTPFLSYLNLEQHTLAKLIFGSTFEVLDIVAYTLGILSILILETKLFNPRTS
ncbi:ribosomal maturation YjgA family protein [Winogradskyella rapida]|uniref:DUF2809 domain-containing protein n=1 Tax=Winogradskyella rapida TaxID=549701 RepID=A0ABW3KQF3_9FLAO